MVKIHTTKLTHPENLQCHNIHVSNSLFIPKKTNSYFIAEQINQLRDDKIEVLSHHNIKEISPIAQSRDGVRENPAATLNSTIHQLADRKYPWLRSDRSRKKHGVYGLHEEIVDFHKWIIATPEEYQMRFEGKNSDPI